MSGPDLVVETTSGLIGRIVGRDAELASLDEFLGSAGSPRAFMLTGGAGIGKTTVWEAGVDLARHRGLRVLSARGSEAETRLSFTALIDLLDGISSEELAALPAPQLHALDVALLRAEPTAAPPEVHAIALGFLNVLRSLAVRQRLVVAIDDLHWLDRASGDVLAFAARRLGDEQISFLLARRPGPATQIERELERRTLEQRRLPADARGDPLHPLRAARAEPPEERPAPGVRDHARQPALRGRGGTHAGGAWSAGDR